MTNTTNGIEESNVKLEYAIAIVEAMKDGFDELIEATNSRDYKEHFTLMEVQRQQKRTESFLSLLSTLLSESEALNNETIKQLMKQDSGELDE